MADVAEHRLRPNELNDDERPTLRQGALTPLNIPNGHDEQQSPSPRTELLSPSSTDRRRASHSQSASDSRRHRRESGRHKRHRDLIHSDTSHRELVRLVVEQETEAEKLRKTLYATLQRLETESHRVRDLERGNREAAERFRQLNASRLLAQQEATRASQELRLYQFQLENAQKQVLTAQETAKLLEKQKQDAEIMAAQARARARRLHQKQLVLQAREEGRRLGFEAGLKESQEEYVATASTSNITQMDRPGLPLATPPTAGPSRTTQSPTEEIEDDVDEMEDEDEEEPEGEGGDILDSPISPSRSRGHRFESMIPPPGLEPHPPPSSQQRPPISEELPLMPVQNSATRSEPRTSHQPIPPQTQGQGPERVYTPSIQVYSLPIPTQENLAVANNLPRNQWVTAQKHREIHGRPEVSPPQLLNPIPNSVPQVPIAPPNVSSQPPPSSHPAPAPAPIFPLPIVVPETAIPPQPQSAGPAPKRAVRFPTLAKTKAQASSWYRSFSLRKKSKPVIDPAEENHPPKSANATTESNGLYKFQPAPPKSWYTKPSPVEVRSQKSQELTKPKSRAASMDDRDSVSTRLSQFDLTSTAPRQAQGEGSIRSNAKRLKEKESVLSIIREDPLSRGNTPNADRFMVTGMKKPTPGYFDSGPSGSGAHPPRFDLARSIGAVSSQPQRRRPPEIYVPPPVGVNDPFVHGNFHLFPDAVAPVPPLTTPGINVQPATAVPNDPPPSTAPHTGRNHLTPNYIYQAPAAPPRTPRRDPLSYSWTSADGAIYTGTGVPLAASNASRKSRHSGHSNAGSGRHRPSHSLGEVLPQGNAEARSVRSNHSRATSLIPHAPYPPDLVSPGGGPPQGRSTPHAPRYSEVPSRSATSRPVSVHTSASNRQDTHNTGEFLAENINRAPSRSSMHSRYDPTKYLDPAFFSVDGQASSSGMNVTLDPVSAGAKSRSRRASAASDLSYV